MSRVMTKVVVNLMGCLAFERTYATVVRNPVPAHVCLKDMILHRSNLIDTLLPSLAMAHQTHVRPAPLLSLLNSFSTV